MTYKVFQDKIFKTDWRVESIDSEGACYVTIFSGPMAEERAKNYFVWIQNNKSI